MSSVTRRSRTEGLAIDTLSGLFPLLQASYEAQLDKRREEAENGPHPETARAGCTSATRGSGFCINVQWRRKEIHDIRKVVSFLDQAEDLFR